MQPSLPPVQCAPENLLLGVMQPEHEDRIHLHPGLMSKQECVQLHVQSLYIFTVGTEETSPVSCLYVNTFH